MSNGNETFNLYLVQERATALLLSKQLDGACAFWVPRSLVISLVRKSRAPKPPELPLCAVTLPYWKCEQLRKEGVAL